MTDVVELAHIIPPQQARSQRFLMKVLEAAEAIMRRDGVEGLTMPAVALEAGVSVGGIYRRFQTKQDLLRAIKDRFLTRAEQSVADALDDGRQKSLDDVVRNFIDTLLKGGPGADLFGLMVESKSSDPSMKARGNATAQRLRDSLARALAPHRAEIAHADPDAAIDMAVFVLLAAIMRRLRSHSSPAAISWPALRRELARMAIAYLKTPA